MSPFLFYIPMMLVALVWNTSVGVAVFRQRRNWPRTVRYAYYLCAALLIPALVCNIAAMSPDGSSLLAFAWLYPCSFLLGAWAGFGCVRHEGLQWWSFAVPLFNLLLAVVFVTRYLAYLGMPVGVVLDGLHVSYAMTQSLTAFFLYIFFPVFDWCPALLLPAGQSRKWGHRLNLLPAIPCALLMALNVLLLPFGYGIASSWRQPLADEPIMARDEFRAGIVLRTKANSSLTENHLLGELARIEDLHLRAVNLFVDNDLMTDDARATTLERFLGRLRQRDITIILTADYPVAWFASPPSDLDQVRREMQPFHRYLVTRFHPDYLVPFIEPYGAFVGITQLRLTPVEWSQLLSESIDAIHDEGRDVRCAVYFGQEENDGELYRLVCGPTSNVDAVGFSFYALYKTREEMREQLASVTTWMKQFGGDKEHWVFEFGQSPLTMGGERAQSHYIQWVTRWAAKQPQFRGVCVFALGDYEEKMGLINSQGRKRPAYHDYRRFATALSGWSGQLEVRKPPDGRFRVLFAGCPMDKTIEGSRAITISAPYKGGWVAAIVKKWVDEANQMLRRPYRRSWQI